jgi:threonine aldolase
MYFSSENFDKTHPQILEALVKCNNGFEPSYGKDSHTIETVALFKDFFGTNDTDVYFCFNGTGANNFALGSITARHHSIFCSDVSHLYVAESTAPETFTGCRLYPLQTINGKIILVDLISKMKRLGDVHHPQPAVLSITQPTEYGTVYSISELKAISQYCKKNNMLLHIDGARLFNALAALDCSASEFIEVSGVDVLTLGGTKSGLMFGEAVVFFNSGRFENLRYEHKRSMQLASKNRFIAAQFHELMRDGLWKQIAKHANNLAKTFEKELQQIDPSLLACPVETNMIFMKMTVVEFEKLKPFAYFYMWDSQREEARFVFSFSNEVQEISDFIEHYKNLSK